MSGVEFGVDIPVDGVDDLLKAATGADRLGDSLRDLDRASGKSNGGLTKSMAIGTALGNVLTGIGHKALEAGRALVELGARGLLALITAVGKAALFRESMTQAFAAISKGASDGTGEMKKMRALAMEFGADFEETATNMRDLMSKGFKMNEAESLFKSMQDLRGFGRSADEISRALLAITQIKAAGRLQGDELNQLAEAGLAVGDVYKELSKITGKSVTEVMKLKEAGKIDAGLAIKAIQAAIASSTGAKNAGDFGKKIANETIGGMLNRIKNMGGLVLDEIAEKLGPALKEIKPILDDVMKAIQGPEAKATIDGIVGAFGTMFGAVKSNWPTVKAFLGGLVEGFTEAAPALKMFAEGMGSALGVLKLFGVTGASSEQQAAGLGKVLAHLAGIMAFIGGAAALLVGAFAFIPYVVFRAGAAIGEGIVVAVRWLVGLPARLAAVAGELSSAAVGLGSSIVDGIVSGITAGVGKVAGAVKSLALSAIGAGKTTLDAHSPSRVFEGIGMSVPQGMERGVWSGVDKVQSATRAVVAPPPVPTVQLGGGGLGGRGGNTVTVTFGDIHVGGDLGKNPGAVIADLKHKMREAVLEVFELTAIQGGL
ncbi:MAG: tape measure protein [Myxococcales bacterium]|nr:tape measure protein [Myxococcales bacterium]